MSTLSRDAANLPFGAQPRLPGRTPSHPPQCNISVHTPRRFSWCAFRVAARNVGHGRFTTIET